MIEHARRRSHCFACLALHRYFIYSRLGYRYAYDVFPPEAASYTEDELYEYAVGALGRRMRTVAELKRLMRREGRGAGDRVAEDAGGNRDPPIEGSGISERLASMRAYYRPAARQQKFGRMRVITDLKIKGVHGDSDR